MTARALAHALGDAAALLQDDPELAAMFESLTADHDALADDLEALVAHLGERPSEGDPDRRGLNKLIRHARAALSSDERMTLLRELERREDELAGQLATAIARTSEHHGELARCVQRVESAQLRLAEQRIRITNTLPH